MSDADGLSWATDVPISLPVPSSEPVLIDMGTTGLTRYGIVHQLTSADLENFIPTYLPGGGSTSGN